jgi:hypothetical protein
MKLLSATDVAIAQAIKAGTLSVVERPSRFAGETYFAISDDVGLIEVQLSQSAADERIAAIRSQI